MSKNKTQYSCSECGAISPKWSGQCGECGGWNTLAEVVVQSSSPARERFSGYAGTAVNESVLDLSDVAADDVIRKTVGIGEFDRVLGGGMVPGSVVLIGGDPGIGKSTLLLQTLSQLGKSNAVLYISGEESPQQISLRANRLKLPKDGIRLLAETQVEQIIHHAQKEKPSVMVIDSIQTIFTEQLQSAPGSVAQVRESSAQLVRFAKRSGISLFIVGHVTKDGQLAGPRVLEHMVDTVLYFEGDSSSRFRVVRAFKNRFGAVNELGVFAMTDLGLKEVANPSAIFLSNREEKTPGSSVMVTVEGSRPLLVEVQSLVDESHLGNPRRVTVGLEQNRLAMLLAVLHRHGGIATYDQDVFVNAVGGVKLSETAADLALVLAVYSSLRNRILDKGLITFGEIGLAGEIRPVPNGQERLKEAAKHGFTKAIIPASNVPKSKITGMEIIGVRRLSEVFTVLD
jgi:DNA repair protein RadA/Sms